MVSVLSSSETLTPLRDRRFTGGQTIAVAACIFAIAAVLSLSIGPTGISLTSFPAAMQSLLGFATDAESERQRLVLLDFRLPRTLIGAFVGAALAVAGALMQGLFRNALADPGLIGVSAGAALAAVVVIAFGNEFASGWVHAFGVYALPFAAFLGGLLTTTLLVAIASRRGTLAIGTLLLAGIAVAAIAGAGIGYISYASDDRELRDLTMWSLGSLSGASWPKVVAIAPFAIVIGLLLPRITRALNGFLLGEAEAYHLGIDTERTKKLVIFITAAAVGAAVSIAGVIGFVGLVAPHLVRLVAGPDHRIVLPASAFTGAALVLVSDIVARMAVAPAELPLGVVMAAIGGPIFLHLVIRRGVGGLE